MYKRRHMYMYYLNVTLQVQIIELLIKTDINILKYICITLYTLICMYLKNSNIFYKGQLYDHRCN